METITQRKRRRRTSQKKTRHTGAEDFQLLPSLSLTTASCPPPPSCLASSCLWRCLQKSGGDEDEGYRVFYCPSQRRSDKEHKPLPNKEEEERDFSPSWAFIGWHQEKRSEEKKHLGRWMEGGKAWLSVIKWRQERSLDTCEICSYIYDVYSLPLYRQISRHTRP